MTKRAAVGRFALAALLLGAVGANAATIKFSSLETELANPDDMMSLKTALWTGWLTQLYEGNMPFIEIANDGDSGLAIEEFTMTIGDTDYNFSNEYKNKAWTNSYPYAADGSWAIAGFSTPDIEFTSSIEDGGDKLVIDFGAGGLQPGEVVRFQVDINGDPGVAGTMPFADYTSVFFTSDADDPTSNPSFVTLDFAGTDLDPSGFVVNPDIPDSISQFFQNPRPYADEQVPPPIPPTPFDVVPEPTGVLLALLAAAGFAARRSG